MGQKQKKEKTKGATGLERCNQMTALQRFQGWGGGSLFYSFVCLLVLVFFLFCILPQLQTDVQVKARQVCVFCVCRFLRDSLNKDIVRSQDSDAVINGIGATAVGHLFAWRFLQRNLDVLYERSAQLALR